MKAVEINGCFTFEDGLQLLFIGLKLTHYINWGWGWVLTPLMLSLVFRILGSLGGD